MLTVGSAAVDWRGVWSVISSSTLSHRPPLSPVVISTEFPSAVGLYKIIEILNFPGMTFDSFQSVWLEHYDGVRLGETCV